MEVGSGKGSKWVGTISREQLCGEEQKGGREPIKEAGQAPSQALPAEAKAKCWSVLQSKGRGPCPRF